MGLSLPGGDDGRLEVKLGGGLPSTASHASIRDDGSLVLEIFDWSEEAQRWLGRDAAYYMIIAPETKPRVHAQLAAEAGGVPVRAGSDRQLLALVEERFPDYYAAKRWLDAAGIPYARDFDSWA